MAQRPSTMMGPAGAGRQSMHPQANNPANMMFGGPSSSANQARLVSKQAELEGLRALKDQSARMVKELERLAEKVDIMADGGDCKCCLRTEWVDRTADADNANLLCMGSNSNRFRHGLVAGRLPRYSDRSRYVLTPDPLIKPAIPY